MENRCCGGCRSRSVTLQLRPCRARFIGRATASFAARTLEVAALHLVPLVRILCTFLCRILVVQCHCCRESGVLRNVLLPVEWQLLGCGVSVSCQAHRFAAEVAGQGRCEASERTGLPSVKQLFAFDASKLSVILHYASLSFVHRLRDSFSWLALRVRWYRSLCARVSVSTHDFAFHRFRNQSEVTSFTTDVGVTYYTR